MVTQAIHALFEPRIWLMGPTVEHDNRWTISGIDGDCRVPMVFEAAGGQHDQTNRHRINPQPVSAPIDHTAVPITGDRSVGFWSRGEQPQGSAPQQHDRKRQPKH